MGSTDQTREHYASLLGSVYAWSMGDEPVERGRRWLDERGLLERPGVVLDLGAGFGAHTIPLAREGAQVVAVDFDDALLDSLRSGLRPTDQVTLHCDDISTFPSGSTHEWDLVLCLGDTLPHLESLDALERMLSGVAGGLRHGGRRVLQWRDTSGAVPDDLARFIEVARDSTRTMHCMIEGVDDHTLRVTDIVTEVTPRGPITRLGSYHKLRLSLGLVLEMATGLGFEFQRDDVEGGMTELHLQRS